MQLIDFIKESNEIEGIFHVSKTDITAHERFLDSDGRVEDLENFVADVARTYLRVRPGMNVRVGEHIAPPGGPLIQPALEKVLQIENIYEQHCAYLTLHPFMDGNGRSARVLWLKRMGKIPAIGFLHTFYYTSLENADARQT